VPDRRTAARARAGVLLALALTAVVLASALAGCASTSGLASKTPAAILTASRTAADTAHSVHVLSDDTQDKGRLSLTLELELTDNGGRAKLSLLGFDYEALRIANTLYIKGNTAFYRRLLHTKSPHVPDGAWLKTPTDTTTLTGVTALTNLSRELRVLLTNSTPLTKGATTTIHRQTTIELEEKPIEPKATGRKLYIATTGKPYPIQIIKHGAENQQTTFTGWNQPITLSTPANTIELTKLEHQQP
jgi:hypothetical protein